MKNQTALMGLALRGLLGGILMGLANLVPGISGGTMLLAVGIYPLFITAVADVCTFKFNLRSLVLLGSVTFAVLVAILLGAGPIKDTVVHHRWVMYSLFIGLTLGGVPLIWKLAPERGRPFWLGSIGGFLVMLLMAVGLAEQSAGDPSYLLFFIAGLIAASAMILPGISGGYLLLLLGMYEAFLGGIHTVKLGLLGDSSRGVSPSMDLVWEAMHVVVPIGLGVVVGIAGVSNLLKWLLNRYKRATLGALFGLLLGAVIGLWPFQEGRKPELGEMLKGKVLTAENIGEVDPEDWPLVQFKPATPQVLGALALIGLGLGITYAIDRVGKRFSDDETASGESSA